MSSVIAKCRTCGHSPLHSSDELEEIIRIPCELCHEKVYLFCTNCEKWIEETICPICRLPETGPEESLGGKSPPETFVRKGVVWVGKVFVGVGCGIYFSNNTTVLIPGQTNSALPIVLFGVLIGVLIGAFLDRTIGRWISIKFRKFGTIDLYPALLFVVLLSASVALPKVATLTVVSNVQYSTIYVDSVRSESAPTATRGDLTRLDLDL